MEIHILQTLHPLLVTPPPVVLRVVPESVSLQHGLNPSPDRRSI